MRFVEKYGLIDIYFEFNFDWKSIYCIEIGGCFYTFQIMFVYMGAFILLSNTTFRHLRQPSKSFEAQAKAFKALTAFLSVKDGLISPERPFCGV